MLIHAENYGIYGGNQALMLNGRYSQSDNGFGGGIVNDPDGVSTGKVLYQNDNSTIRRALQTPTGKVGMGARFWCNALPPDNNRRPQLFYWNDAANVAMLDLLLNTTGSLTFRCWDTTLGQWIDLATTPGPVMTPNAWWQVEAVFDATGVSCEVRVEGVSKLIVNTAGFGGHLHNGPTIYQGGIRVPPNYSLYNKDLFWWDGLGSQNNNFLGSCVVAEIDPDGDTTKGGWTLSTGTAMWSILANASPGSTPYAAAASGAAAAVMTQTNLPAAVTSVKGIMTILRAAKVDGGDGNMQVSMKSGASTGNGANRPITAAQTYWEDVFELDPATGAAWLPSAVDNSSIQINRTV